MSSLKRDRGLKLQNKYIDDLKDYILIENEDDLNNVSKGNWIRYVDFQNHELIPCAGILIKTTKKKGRIIITLMSIQKCFWTINFNQNYIYYKKKFNDNDIKRSFLENLKNQL